MLIFKTLKSSRFAHLRGFLDLGLVCGGVWLAGGALRTILSKDEIKDYDLFFKDEAFFYATTVHLEVLGAIKTFECPKKELFTYKYGNLKIQLIKKRYYESPEVLLNSFDFTVCQFCWNGRVLFVSSKNSIKDSKNRNLRINEIQYPVASLNRLVKYAKRGYKYFDALDDFISKTGKLTLTEENRVLYID